ncbi:MAG TPA: hypothetical protein VFI11_05835 [Anaerolineales bacterium]|nr:hypothetical protein [Anaerolineales bacterium]
MDVVLILGVVSGLTIVVAIALVVVDDHRLALVFYLLEYLCVGGLLYIGGFPAAAWTRWGLAVAAAPIVWLTVVRLGRDVLPYAAGLRGGRWFRLSAALLVAVGGMGFSSSLSGIFPGLTPAHARAASALFTLGLLQLGLSEDPLRWIFALTTCLLGFEVVYAIIEPSLAIQAILASIHLGILVVGTDIAVRRAAPQNPDDLPA